MEALFLFDGECRFSSTAARAVQRTVRPDCIVMPYQLADLQRWRVSAVQARAEMVFVRRVEGAEVVLGGAPALAGVFSAGRPPWPLAGSVLRLPGVRTAAQLVYRAAAANRYRLPGGTPACQLDRADEVVGAG